MIETPTLSLISGIQDLLTASTLQPKTSALSNSMKYMEYAISHGNGVMHAEKEGSICGAFPREAECKDESRWLASR